MEVRFLFAVCLAFWTSFEVTPKLNIGTMFDNLILINNEKEFGNSSAKFKNILP